MYLCTFPKSSTRVSFVENTHIFYFCTKLDLRESPRWLSSHLPWPTGLATYTSLCGIPAKRADSGRNRPINELAGYIPQDRWTRKGQSLGRRCLAKSLSGRKQRTCLPTKHVNSSMIYLDRFWGLLKTLIYWLIFQKLFNWGPHAQTVHKIPHLCPTFLERKNIYRYRVGENWTGISSVCVCVCTHFFFTKVIKTFW